jgi:uncharacterized protein
MAKILIHITKGPEDPTRAALGPVLDSLVGLGTGSLRESYDALAAGGARFYVSGMSTKARGFEPDGKAEAATPAQLVELALEHDRVLTY